MDSADAVGEELESAEVDVAVVDEVSDALKDVVFVKYNEDEVSGVMEGVEPSLIADGDSLLTVEVTVSEDEDCDVVLEEVLVVSYVVDAVASTRLLVELGCACEELDSVMEPERVETDTVLEDNGKVADGLVKLHEGSGMDADMDADPESIEMMEDPEEDEDGE